MSNEKLKDVNPSEDASTSETDAKAEALKLDGLDEKDLEVLSKEKQVPYSRFKEVIESKKQLQDRLKTIESRMESELQRAREDERLRAEMLVRQKQEEQSVSDEEPWTRIDRQKTQEISQLEKQVRELREMNSVRDLKETMKELKVKYPHANEIAALGIKKASPGVDLEEVMASLHDDTVTKAESMLRNLVDAKKKKAESSVPTKSSSIKLKPEEKPKSLRDAAALTKRWLNSQ